MKDEYLSSNKCQVCWGFPAQTQDKPKNKAAQSLGSLGGRAGTGAAKRRSPEHYKRMTEIRWANKHKRESANACGELKQDVASENEAKTV